LGGLGLFAFVVRLLRTVLFGFTASDPLTLGGSALILLAVAGLSVSTWSGARLPDVHRPREASYRLSMRADNSEGVSGAVGGSSLQSNTGVSVRKRISRTRSTNAAA
jgi:hypothetical protein